MCLYVAFSRECIRGIATKMLVILCPLTCMGLVSNAS